MILNHTLQDVVYSVMECMELPEITQEDIQYAAELTRKALAGMPGADPGHPIPTELEKYTGQDEIAFGSTDVGDVSWVCPTVQIMAATHAIGTP